MLRHSGQKLGLIFLVCDLVATSLVWMLAYYLRFALWASPLGMPPVGQVLDDLPLLLFLAAIAYRQTGLYEVHRLRALPRELGGVCQASALLFLLVIAAAFYQRDVYESRLALGLFAVLNVAALAGARRILWALLKAARGRGHFSGRGLIIGSGRTGRLVLRTLAANHWTGLKVVGFVDRPGKYEPAALPRLGHISDLAQVVREHNIDQVFVALPLTRYDELHEVYRRLSDCLVEVHWVPDLPNLTGMRVRTLELDGVGFLSLRGNPHCGWRKLVKRGMDIAVSSLAIVLLAPLMALLALLVKWTSQGPVLYRQPRAGLGGETFDMLKFRSMRIDAEHKHGPVWARRNDDRCTTLGAFMRRWSLDELPQLFNVLKGDMSLVGPRPERGVFIEKFRQQLPSYWQRHQVKAGITGWAQVNGWRGNTSARRRLEYDLWYISNWSPWLDLKILFMTLWCGFRHRHAY